MDFSAEILKFQKTGVYAYQIDDGGNLLVNSQAITFNQHYVSVPLQTNSYLNEKINTFYPIGFSEFIPTKISTIPSSSIENLQSTISQSQEKIDLLQKQINDLQNLQQTNSSAADILASKQTIINLRISLGQGKIISDFNSTFPYSPLK